jgi:hypothetical protein
MPGNYRGSPWYQSAARCLQTFASPRVPARGSGVQKQRSCTDIVCSRILKEAGKANKTVYAFFLDVRKAYDTVWMGYPWLLEKVESYGGSCRPSY